jgi:hypothetical protein
VRHTRKVARGRRPARRVAVATAVTLLVLFGLLPAGARATHGGLVVVTETRYDVFPDEGRVHVTIDAVATSHEPDTAQGRTFYSGVSFAVPPNAQGVSARSGNLALPVTIEEQNEAYSGVAVEFSRGVFFGQSYAYQVQFDLLDPGGVSGRDLRIGPSLVAFPVWGFGTGNEPGSRVAVALPPGYRPSVQGGPMELQVGPDGGAVLVASPADPLSFFAYVSADRPGAFSDTTLELELDGKPATILVRAWEDDVDWGARTTDLLTDGFPALRELIGLPYPLRGRLTVEEAAVSRLGEYAGTFNEVTGVIRIRYDADAYVALHEAAHVWFNGRLWESRWINEGFAELYAVAAGDAIGAEGFTYELSDDLLEHRIPLDEWGAVGVEDLAVEDFAYAASYELAEEILERAGTETLGRVWVAADEGHAAYQPAHDDEPVIGARFRQPEWQRLLDLLEERSGEPFADLWESWVLAPSDARLLDARAAARERYAEVVAAAGAWELPDDIREQMGDWEFNAAVDQLAVAVEVLAHREAIAARAAELELAPPDDLRRAFEGGSGLDDAIDEAAAQLASLDMLDRAADVLATEPTILESIGLLGTEPQAQLTDARASFEEGELEEADAAARRAVDLRAEAAELGTARVVLTGGGILLLDGLALVALSAVHLRRPRRVARTSQTSREEPEPAAPMAVATRDTPEAPRFET